MITLEEIDDMYARVVHGDDGLSQDAMNLLCEAARRGVESEVKPCCGLWDDCTERCVPRANAWKERAERAEAAIIKLVGAIDMIRETIHGGNVQDLLLIINNALDEARNV